MGLKMKYVVPRSVLHSLRRAIQATNRIASSDDSTFHSSTAQSSLLSSQPSVIDSSQTSVSLPPPLQQSPSTRQEELMKLTRDALADLCRRYGIRRKKTRFGISDSSSRTSRQTRSFFPRIFNETPISTLLTTHFKEATGITIDHR